MHEASRHDANSFLTLTYDDDHVPAQGQLVKHHFQDFMKRLRFHLSPIKVRFYACGEYGESFDRPHFHAVLFGHAFYDDRVPIRKASSGFLYNSPTLDRLWSFGFCSIGDVTFDSAAYVAGYCLKKVTGDKAKDHYTRVDGPTGEIYEKVPEFALMSNRPGIGADWLDTYSSDLLNAGGLMINDTKRSIPRYYLDRLAERDGWQRELLEVERLKRRKPIDPRDLSYERERVREEVLKSKLSTKSRSL